MTNLSTVEARRDCLDCYDAATEALENGDINEARSQLQSAASLENAYGDDTHARRALSAIE
jgi:hypothetical protein